MPAFQERYVGPLQAINARHGVELIVGTPSVQVLEGSYDKDLTVVLKFPSAQAQAAWYGDPDYQPLLKIRHAVTNTETSIALVAPAA